MAYSFTDDSRELWLDTAEPERSFDNMMYNEAYFTQIDQTMRGGGVHMSDEGYACQVIADERVVYVRDDETGVFFSAGFAPVFRQYESYRCGSGLNYQIVENVTDGLKVTWRIYLPVGADPVEVWDVRVENPGARARRVSLVTEMGMTCDGVDLFGGFLYRRASYVEDVNSVFVLQDGERHRVINFPWHNAFVTADRQAVSWDTNQAKFMGPRGNLANPEALAGELCKRSVATRFTPTGTLQVRFEVPAGGKADTRFLVGACDGPPTIAKWRRKYLGGNLDADRHFDALVRDQARLTENMQVELPEASMRPLFNVWMKHQMHYGATHCRWGYKGFRDIVQQAQGILALDPARSRAIIARACAHQYRDGFALRGWHPIDPLRYADSAQWMISTVTEYIKETGDFDLLKERVAYYDGGSGTVYEHLMKAMKRLHTDRGAHGLCLIFFGDWNDSLTGVGRKGRGESVWLSMAFCRGALLMEELAGRTRRKKDAAAMRRWHTEMARAINSHAWDGGWYLCALDDDGRPIGSKKNKAGKIFLNMQSWAQLGGVCDDGRWDSSWKNVLKRLDTGWGLMLNWPTYMEPVDNIGRMSYMRPGICENGSVYTHGNAFMLLALLQRGMADEALALLREIDPTNPRRPMLSQPNSYYNGCLGPAGLVNVGMAEHVWCTGSAAWVYLCMTEFVLGLRRTYDGLVVKPCMPSQWPAASVTRTYRGTTYRVAIENPDRKAGAPVAAIAVDGKAHPVDKPLPVDGGTHEVSVRVG